jgi:RNA polymerase sigma factor (TIGR02999 family)
MFITPSQNHEPAILDIRGTDPARLKMGEKSPISSFPAVSGSIPISGPGEIMSAVDDHDVTGLVSALAAGDARASACLFERVYDELHRVATACFRQQPADHTLEPTALLHEGYLRLMHGASLHASNRKHFFALAARAMRQVLIDHARAKQRDKRGGGWNELTLSAVGLESADAPVDAIALDEALHRLGQADERKARLVELRFFAGLTMDEAAEALGISRATAADDWTFARAWLLNELRDGWTA